MEESMLSKSVKGLSSSDLVGSLGGITDRYVCVKTTWSAQELILIYFIFLLFRDEDPAEHRGLSTVDIYLKEVISHLSLHSIRQKDWTRLQHKIITLEAKI